MRIEKSNFALTHVSSSSSTTISLTIFKFISLFSHRQHIWNLSEQASPDKPHPSGAPGKTNAGRHFQTLSPRSSLQSDYSSFNIDWETSPQVYDEDICCMYTSESVCSGVLDALCSSSCHPRQKLCKHAEPHVNTHADTRTCTHTQDNGYYPAHLGSRLRHPPNIF